MMIGMCIIYTCNQTVAIFFGSNEMISFNSYLIFFCKAQQKVLCVCACMCLCARVSACVETQGPSAAWGFTLAGAVHIYKSTAELKRLLFVSTWK
jgi:hypothetical protein